MSLAAVKIALKTDILASLDPLVIAARAAPRNDTELARLYSLPSTFVVRKTLVSSKSIGPILNYVAVSNLTTINRDRATTFVTLNPDMFAPTADVETYWDTTFAGALGGQGQATRDALAALWRRFATRVERLLATGTGTTAAPGALVFEGALTAQQVSDAMEA